MFNRFRKQKPSEPVAIDDREKNESSAEECDPLISMTRTSQIETTITKEIDNIQLDEDTKTEIQEPVKGPSSTIVVVANADEKKKHTEQLKSGYGTLYEVVYPFLRCEMEIQCYRCGKVKWVYVYDADIVQSFHRTFSTREWLKKYVAFSTNYPRSSST